MSLSIWIVEYKRSAPEKRVVKVEEFDTKEELDARYKTMHDKFWEDFHSKKQPLLRLPCIYPVLTLPGEEVEY
ncbi:hypothetical protein phiMK_151 [Pseudomonas phage phiMK]|uniref:Uncharacterized protein n=2 Tax=Pakpunavirus TaxID=1921407 RepID=V5JW12_9CAUD|nr:hypothetical protein X831_gp145 [Pseudomonas phage PAK_P2]YP_009291219.1 hypothetical protein BI047_gp039 [Pseudomonas phage phiMK]AGR89265.1 hypothetical protein PAK_P200144c [Pseudomonas phage PAK_P2]AMQ66339.1 hypothetical protein phiMK_151 [Pseudomonas phage phiMK]